MEAGTGASGAGGRERILRAAYARFLEAGYAAASMQQIADAAGVNKATLYHHFRDKEDLFREVVRLSFVRAHEALAAAIAQGASLREKLLALASHLFSAERADLHRLASDLRQHLPPEQARVVWQDLPPPWTYLERAIGEGIARGELAPLDAEIAARVCLAALMGQVQFAKFEAAARPPDMELAAEVVEILLKGLEARAGEPA